MPVPNIRQACDDQGRAQRCTHPQESTAPQTAGDFVAYVQSIIRDRDTPIYTLCRTGVGSVGAANVLTDAGYTCAISGRASSASTLLRQEGQADALVVVSPVDLNHDGELTDRDKNGWHYHRALPYDKRLLPKLICKPMAAIYAYD